MPELPDVESFKAYFKRSSLNKIIADVQCSCKDLIRNINFKDLRHKLMGKSFRDAWRRGKFLICEIKDIPEKLIFHFGMTGDLHYVKQRTKKDRFARLVIKFENEYELRLLSIRKLAKIYLVKDPEEIKLIKEMGPEPLTISKKDFSKILDEHQRKNIKAFLLDQRDIAGIGNVYSDEILFKAKINPHKNIETVGSEQREKLYKSMKTVLREAIDCNMYFDSSWLIVHRGRDMRCPLNENHKLKKEIIAGRSCYFCPVCQANNSRRLLATAFGSCQKYENH